MRTYARQTGHRHHELHRDLLLKTYDCVPVLDYVVQETIEVRCLRYGEHVAQLMQEMSARARP